MESIDRKYCDTTSDLLEFLNVYVLTDLTEVFLMGK